VGGDPLNNSDPTGQAAMPQWLVELFQRTAPPPTGEQIQQSGGDKSEVLGASIRSAEYKAGMVYARVALDLRLVDAGGARQLSLAQLAGVTGGGHAAY